MHSASTKEGSSGSPIIRRGEDNYVIGLHRGFYEKDGKDKKDNNNYSFNLGTIFDSILNDIRKNKLNEIECIYKLNLNDEKENKFIQLLNDLSFNVETWGNKNKKPALKANKINKKIFENNIDIYINGKKIPFTYKYKIDDNKEIKVKFLFKQNLTTMC